MKKLALLLALLLSGAAQAQTNFSMPPPAGVFVGGFQVVASCGAGTLITTQPAYATMDTTGVLCTSSGGGGGSLSAKATAAAPTYVEGSTDPLSMDLSGNTRVIAQGIAQGSTTSGQTGSLVMGAVTTAPPTYSNAQSSPVSLTTGGGVRNDVASIGGTAVVADPCQAQAQTPLPISITTATTTNILVGTAAKKIYVCYLYLQTAAANNVAVIEGTTGATCGSSTKALVGGVTAANGLNNAANSGQAFVNGGNAVLQTTVNNNDICIITSAATPLAGIMRYVVQ